MRIMNVFEIDYDDGDSFTVDEKVWNKTNKWFEIAEY